MKLAAYVLAGLILAGCATSNYGNYVNSPEIEAAIAADVAAKLNAEFPAANTVFTLQTDDSFGTGLDQALRENGFATTRQKNDESKALNYVIDRVYADMYRVIIYVDSVPYSRAYTPTDDGRLVPVGSWTRKD